MANKKIKPVSEFISEPETEPETVVEKLAAEAPVLGSAHAFNDKVKAELARLETVENENLRLNRENQDLTERIAQYLDEIEKLKASKKQDEDSDMLKKLTEENDKYLMKISELTFENAKLEAKLQNLQSARSQPRQQHVSARSSDYRNVYRTSASQNGYSSWN